MKVIYLENGDKIIIKNKEIILKDKDDNIIVEKNIKDLGRNSGDIILSARMVDMYIMGLEIMKIKTIDPITCRAIGNIKKVSLDLLG